MEIAKSETFILVQASSTSLGGWFDAYSYFSDKIFVFGVQTLPESVAACLLNTNIIFYLMKLLEDEEVAELAFNQLALPAFGPG
jgi:hypothetical protein